MAYTPREFPTPTISPAGAGTVSVVKTTEEIYSDGWYNAWTITATAKPGYRFVKFEYTEWEDYPKPGHETSGDYTSSPWYVEQQGVDWGGETGYEEWYYTSVRAVFEADPYYLKTVTTDSIPSAGGSTSGDGSYAPGDNVTISATANAGYRFKEWVNSTTAEISSNATHTFTMPSYNVFWIAYFEVFVPPVTDHLILHSHSTFTIRQQTGKFILRDA